MRRTGNQEQLLLLRARRTAITQLGHIERVGDAAGHHQQRLLDKIHALASIERHQIDKAALGVAERRIGVRMALQVIAIAVAIEVERQCGSLFGRYAAHVAHVFDFSTLGLFLAGDAGICQTLLHAVYLRVEKSITAHQSRIEHAERSARLEPFVGLCRCQRIAATAADAENTHTVCIHTRIVQQDVGGTADVIDAVGRLVRIARLALAGSLIGGIERQADITFFRHALTVKSCYLLLHSAVRVRYDEGRIAFRGVVARRRIDIGGNFQPVQVVGNGADIHLARNIFGNGIGIDQSPRVTVVALEGRHICRGECFVLFHCLLCV